MIAIGFLLAAVSVAGNSDRPATQPTTQAGMGWKLVWGDEFNGDGAPDPAKWSFEKGFIRNKEEQYYTDRPENVRVEKGMLVIEARKEEFPVTGSTSKPASVATFTSGSIETRGKFEFTYGKVECRTKVPTGRGTWPAIWMLGSNTGKVGWPTCGEIDIMESVGFETDVLHGSVHTKAYNHVIHTQRTKTVVVKDMAEDFHVYGMEWGPEKVELLVDGEKYFEFANEHKTEKEWPFDGPEFLKLNFAVGGTWGTVKGIEEEGWPRSFLVDWVRVWGK